MVCSMLITCYFFSLLYSTDQQSHVHIVKCRQNIKRSTENKPRQETQDVAASQGQTPQCVGKPFDQIFFIFNNSAERNSAINLIHISSGKPQISSISIGGFIIKLGQMISHKPTVGLTSFHHQKFRLPEEVQINLQRSSNEEIFQATQVNLYFCSCSFSFSSFQLQTRAVDILQIVRRIDFIPPPKVAAFRGGSDEPTARFQRGDLRGHTSQSLLLQLQLQIQQLPGSHV